MKGKGDGKRKREMLCVECQRGGRFVDVTRGFLDAFGRGDEVVVPRGHGGELRIRWLGNTLTVRAQSPLRLRRPSAAPPPRLVVFYFVNGYINVDQYTPLFDRQFAHLRQCGLYDACAELHCVASLPPSEERRFAAFVETRYPKCRLRVTADNVHEYPGIHAVWAHAQEGMEEDIYLYFHSKGITRAVPGKRDATEKRVFDAVIAPFRSVVAWLRALPDVSKAGASAGKEGHVWHNVWWAKRAYLRGQVEPVLTQDRYYYEHWLGMRAEGTTDYHSCLALDGTTEMLGAFYAPPPVGVPTPTQFHLAPLAPVVAPIVAPIVAPLHTPIVTPLHTPVVAPLHTHPVVTHPVVTPLHTLPLVAPLRALPRLCPPALPHRRDSRDSGDSR